MTGSPTRSASALRISKPPQPASPKFVAPLEEMTPSALAGPGVSRPIARTAASGTPVSASTCSTASIRDWMALSGPSRTLLGTSAIWSRRNRPAESRIVPLFVVPPLSRPTTTQSNGMRPPRPAAEPRFSLGKCASGEQYRQRPADSVGAGEDQPLAVGGRLAAADARALLGFAVQRDAAGSGRGFCLDLVFTRLIAAVQRQRPADRHGGGELGPGMDRDGVVVAEVGGPPCQHGLERGQLGSQQLGRRIERDGLLGRVRLRVTQ